MSIIISESTISVGNESIGNFEKIKELLKNHEEMVGMPEDQIKFLAKHLANPANSNVIWNYKELISFNDYMEYLKIQKIMKDNNIS